MNIHELIVYLRAADASAAINFYAQAFGAVERYRLVEPSGRIGHAELVIGEAEFYISDEFPEMDVHAPNPTNPGTFIIHIHVDDADECIAAAVAAGATLIREPANQFFGERSGTIRDPFGYDWLIGHSIEDVDPEEMQRRYTALFD
ncbi:MAG: VOC family protein [Pseudomonadota bacterium]